MSDTEFISGLYIDKPSDKAPDFIKMNGSMDGEQLFKWMKETGKKKFRFVVKESKGGKYYATVDNWEPKKQAEPKTNDFYDDPVGF